MTIFKRILLVMLLPLAMSAVFGGRLIYLEQQQFQALQSLKNTMAIKPAISNAIHELQRERGSTAGFFGARSEAARARLDSQRQATDVAVSDFQRAVVQFGDQAGRSFDSEIEEFQRRLDALTEVRSAVDASEVTLGQMASTYTQKIELGLDIVSAVRDGVTNPEISVLSQALLDLMFAKEKMGLERAMGANGYGAGQFRPGIYNRFVGLQAQQQVYLAGVAEALPESLQADWLALSEGADFEALKALRERAIASGLAGNLGDVTAGEWFRVITVQIDALKAIEDRLSAEIITLVEAKAKTKLSIGILDAVSVIAVLLGSGVLSVYVARRMISNPISDLAVVCSELAQDKKVTIPYLERKDEIGGLANSMRSVADASLARKRIRAALINTSSKLMIVSRGNIKYVHPELVEHLAENTDNPDEIRAHLRTDERLERIEALSKAISDSKPTGDGVRVIQDFAFCNRRFLLHVAPAVDEDGEDLGIVIEWRDITERRQMENALSDLVSSASKGDFSNRVSTTSDDTLLANMAEGVNAVCESVETFLSDLNKSLTLLAKGDLTRPVQNDYRGQLNEAAQNCSATIATLRKLISSIASTGQALGDRSETLRSGAEQISARAGQQTAELTGAVNVMRQITETVDENASDAGRANTLASDTRQKVELCNATMLQTVDAIHRMEASSEAISDIISIIQSIAVQTNLLALNAAVEAARAGQAGAGFAVVASEVRALAQRSSDAADDINQRIQLSVAEIKSGVDLVTEAGAALEEIRGAVDETASMIGNIATASTAQAERIGDMRSMVATLETMTSENASVAKTGATAARDVASLSGELIAQTEKFEIEGNGSHSSGKGLGHAA